MFSASSSAFGAIGAGDCRGSCCAVVDGVAAVVLVVANNNDEGVVAGAGVVGWAEDAGRTGKEIWLRSSMLGVRAAEVGVLGVDGGLAF